PPALPPPVQIVRPCPEAERLRMDKAERVRQAAAMSDELTTTLVRFHPETAASVLEHLDPDEAVHMLGGWPADVTGRVLERMLPHAAGAVLERLGPESCAALLLDMQPREAARVLQQFEADERDVFLSRLPEDDAVSLRALGAYPPETAGGMMDTRVATLRDHLTVAQAIDAIRRAPPGSLHYLYVVDPQERLRGVLVMRDMLLAAPQTRIAEIMRTELTTLPEEADRERISEIFEAHGYAVLPVVDEEDRLVGVVRHDAVIEAVVEEAYEDMQLMVGAGAGERALDRIGVVVKGRLPWLLINLGTAFLASVVVGLFEGTIATITALAVLLTIVAGQSGNTGAQTMAVVMRGLVMGEVRPGVRWRILRKEMLGGLINGIGVALVCGIGVLLWDGRPLLGLVIAVSMVMSTVAGTLIPVLIAAAGRDPAQSSSIFLTTVTDVVGFGSFLGIAAPVAQWLVV
ncbi:MAG: magnesium transporter, partial [Planctomycetota bacterium]